MCVYYVVLNRRQSLNYRLTASGGLLPPVLGVMEDATIALALVLLEEGELIAYAKLYVLADVEVSLGRGLQVQIVPHAILHTEADVVEGLIGTCIFIIIEQGAFAVAIDGVIAIVVVA